MSGKQCAVKGCCSYGMVNLSKTFHRFPRDKDSCYKWLVQSGRSDLYVLFNQKGPLKLNAIYYVCSDHFHDEDYRNPAVKSQGLKPGRFPTRNLHSMQEAIMSPPSPKKRQRPVVFLENNTARLEETNINLQHPVETSEAQEPFNERLAATILTQMRHSQPSFIKREVVDSTSEINHEETGMNIQQPGETSVIEECSNKKCSRTILILKTKEAQPQCNLGKSQREDDILDITEETGLNFQKHEKKNSDITECSNGRLMTTISTQMRQVQPVEKRPRVETTFKIKTQETSDNIQQVDKTSRIEKCSSKKCAETLSALKKKVRQYQKLFSKEKIKVLHTREQNKKLKKLLLVANKSNKSFCSTCEMRFSERDKGNGRRYTVEERNRALGLYRCSPSAYEYERKYVDLPDARSLRRWVKKLKVTSGIDDKNPQKTGEKENIKVTEASPN